MNEFSDFARMPKPILRNNDLVMLVRDNIKLLKEIDLSIEIIFINNNDIVLFNSDKEQISRVFFNLIKNSIESIVEKATKISDFKKKLHILLSSQYEGLL